jgi:hypothetical protein
MKEEMDLYSDSLLSCFGRVTATGLPGLLDGVRSHDKITWMLSGNTNNSKDLWQEIKPLVWKYESEAACLIFDDTPYTTDGNGLISLHRDHRKGCNEKDINLLTAFYHTPLPGSSEALQVPAAFECVKKSVRFCEIKTRKERRQSLVTKNEMMRLMLQQSVGKQHRKFRYVLADSWFSSSDNLLFIAGLKKYFVMDMKNNRLCMFSTQDRYGDRWTGMDRLPLQAERKPVKVWIKYLETEVFLCKYIFTNRSGSRGEIHLPGNDLELSTEDFRILCKKRWSVEEYHKYLKQNASLEKSPTRTVTMQTGHLPASLSAYVKPERFKFIHRLNHFALKSAIYFRALKNAWKELETIENYHLA